MTEPTADRSNVTPQPQQTASTTTLSPTETLLAELKDKVTPLTQDANDQTKLMRVLSDIITDVGNIEKKRHDGLQAEIDKINSLQAEIKTINSKLTQFEQRPATMPMSMADKWRMGGMVALMVVELILLIVFCSVVYTDVNSASEGARAEQQEVHRLVDAFTKSSSSGTATGQIVKQDHTEAGAVTTPTGADTNQQDKQQEMQDISQAVVGSAPSLSPGIYVLALLTVVLGVIACGIVRLGLRE